MRGVVWSVLHGLGDDLAMTASSAPETCLVEWAQASMELERGPFLKRLDQHPSLRNLQNKLHYQFVDKQKLINSLCHSSFFHENPQFFERSNETLEFLGDALLGAICADELLRRFPDVDEGRLSTLRGSLVNAESLAKLSRFLGLDVCLLLGRGELKNGGMKRVSLLADVFEAFLGALYLDSDFQTVQTVLRRLFESYTIETGDELFSLKRIQNFDYKTQLQEKAMAEFKSLPEYSSERLENNQFEVRLKVGAYQFGPLVNASKKRAEKLLAEQAFNELKEDYAH